MEAQEIAVKTPETIENNVDNVEDTVNIHTEHGIQSFHGHNLRRNLQVQGSNCILIERGIIPPYYDCIGCVVSLAMACLEDMRLNRTGAVATGCELSAAAERYRSGCCPHVSEVRTNVYNLVYPGSAYPQALSCIKAVGCGTSTIYTQLLDECKSTCPVMDPRVNGRSVCLATFNSAISTRQLLQKGYHLLFTMVGGLAVLLVVM